MMQRIDKRSVEEALRQAYERCKDARGGKNADYIPYLKEVPSDLFGIAACLPDGEVVAVGDTDYRFGIESVSKVPTAILAMNQTSGEEVLRKIGADATGLPFNSIMAILLEKDHPSTPLVNAGAIAACSMIRPAGDSDAKWRAIRGFISELAGSEVEVIDELYRSETATNFNNKSIAWLLKNYDRIYDDPDLSLDIYTRQCSLGVTARQLAVMAATIANGGVNPVTGREVFKPELAPKITAMMATVGFYEHTGDWLFSTGLPAKTGVGGGIMGVVPGVIGVAAFAPPLDEAGNSVKAQQALAYISLHLHLGVFDSTRILSGASEAEGTSDDSDCPAGPESQSEGLPYNSGAIQNACERSRTPHPADAASRYGAEGEHASSGEREGSGAHPSFAPGASGSQGRSGSQGQAGPQRASAAQGQAGSQGASAAQGQAGSQGASAAQGQAGSQGAAAQGQAGSQRPSESREPGSQGPSASDSRNEAEPAFLPAPEPADA